MQTTCSTPNGDHKAFGKLAINQKKIVKARQADT